MWIEGEFFQRPAEGFSVAAWRDVCDQVQACMACMALLHNRHVMHFVRVCVFLDISSQNLENKHLKADGETYAPFAIYNRALEQL